MKLIANSPENFKNPYVVLKGYYRSYQLVNGETQYYAEGFIEYYIKKNSNKKRITSQNILENRVYEDANVHSKLRKGWIDINTVFFEPPILNEIPFTQELKKRRGFKALKKKETENLILTVKKDTLGFYEFTEETGFSNVFIDELKGFKKDKIRFLGYDFKPLGSSQTQFFSKSNGQFSDETYENLIKVIQDCEIFIKHKKDKKYKRYRTVDEFYVMNVNVIGKNEFSSKKLKSFNEVQLISNFDSEYDDKVNNLNIPQLPDYVKSKIGKSLLLKQ